MDPNDLPLRDIHLPDPVGLWPLAYGWWLLFVGGLVGALVAGLWRRHRRRRQPLRQALVALDDASVLHEQGKSAEAMQLVSTTLRRLAMTLSVEDVAGLTGDTWLAWLDSRWSRAGFATGPGRLLVEAPYRPPAGIDAAEAQEVIALARGWVQAQQLGRPAYG